MESSKHNSTGEQAKTANYKRQAFILKLIISFLVIVIAAGVIYLLDRESKGHAWRQPVDDNIAGDNVKKFRGRVFPKSKGWGVIYDPAEIRDYLDNTFRPLVDSQERYMGRNKPDGYVWKLAFYWMKAEDPKDKKNKTDFLVLPVLVNERDETDVLDYFEKNYSLYDHWMKPPYPPGVAAMKGNVRVPDSTGFGFNTGTMFP